MTNLRAVTAVDACTLDPRKLLQQGLCLLLHLHV